MAALRTLFDMPCAVCGVVFRPRAATQVCCSHKCGHEYKRTLRPRPCQSCGVDFLPRSQAVKYCCAKCRTDGRRSVRKAECKTCGGEFIRPVGRRQDHCSYSCSKKGKTHANAGRASPAGAVSPSGDGYLKEKTADGTWVQQHRLVMERRLGRKLARTEHVHHKDGDRANNALENLELWVTKGRSKKDPSGQRLEDVLADFLNQPEIRGIEAQAEAAFRRVFHIEA